MDCLEAREIISEAFDRGVAEVPLAAEARSHCRDCAECRRFVEGLALLRKTPAPAAPAALVESIVERGRMMAEAGVPRTAPRDVEPTAEEEGEPVSAASPTAPLAPVPRRESNGSSWWMPRIAIAGVAVAVSAFALFLSFQGFRALRPSTAGNEPSLTEFDGGQQAPKAAPPGSGSGRVTGSADSAQANLSAGAAAGSARYLALGDEAYTWVGVRSPDPTSMTQLETQATSSLDSSAAPMLRTVWRSKTDADIVFLRSSDTSETYAAFRRVVRTFGGKLYSLWGSGITAYGQWPALPSQFATPTAADGSPTFVSAGKDDSGLEIYAPQGSPADKGFAVGPGTTPGDPAAGDPNWTWWFPKP